MTKQTKTKDRARREFLRTGALAGAGATIAAALPGAALAVEPQTGSVKPNENYRLTPHIADYYKTLS